MVDGLAGLTYIVIQTVPFAVLAGLIMRLKLFLTPHLALLTSLLAHRQVSPPLASNMTVLMMYSCAGV